MDEMNTPKAPKKEHEPSEQLDENLTERQKLAPKAESSSLTDLPRRASTVTPVLMDMLARIEGVARWGLNE